MFPTYLRLPPMVFVRTDLLPAIHKAAALLNNVPQGEAHQAFTEKATGFDPRTSLLTLAPVVAPSAGPENELAGWYKPTTGTEGAYLQQPIGYPDLPRSLTDNLSAMCDHCGRLVYNQTFFIFRNRATGGWTQVSAGCLAEYLGSELLSADLQKWVALYNIFVSTIRGAMLRAGREHFGVLEVIQTALQVSAVHGFVSRGQAAETGATATAARVLDHLEYGKVEWHNTLAGREIAPEELLRLNALAAEIVLWMHTQYSTIDKEEDRTDYLHNLWTVGTHEYVEARSVGILSSAPGAYAAWQKRKEAERNRPRVDPGRHFGTLSDRVQARIFVDEVEDRGETEYGRTLLVHMHVVPTGERLSWWTGEGLKLDPQTEYNVRMTIVKHGVWDGRNITTVNRVMEYNGPTPRKKKAEK